MVYHINLFAYIKGTCIPGMEKVMTPHSSTLVWKIPWTEEPTGRLHSMRLWRVRHDWVTSLSLFTFMHWRRKWQPTPVFLPGESQGQRSLVAAIYGVAQSRTQLKWLRSSSTTLWKRQCLHHFRDEKTESQSGDRHCPSMISFIQKNWNFSLSLLCELQSPCSLWLMMS